MMVLDTDGRIVDLNPAAMSILGRPANHLQGQNVAKWLPGCAGIVSGPAARKPAQTEISLGPDGALRDYELNLSPLKDRNDVLLGSLLLLHDVTAQRQTQAQILEQQRALAALRERELVARELHDGLGQVLGYVKMQTQAARDRLAQNQTKAADHNLAQLLAVAQDAHADLREYILGATSVTHTHTSFLDTLGQYLRAFNEHYALHAELVAPADLKDDTFEPTVEAQLLRIIQEALTNARKHARAQCVEVRMQLDGCRAQVIVQDDGAGFDPALPGTAQAQKYGLGFMRERAEAVGGSVEIHSAPGVGTQVIISVPRRQPTTLSDLDVRNMERR
jgi:PAS domain S-box-containing protein